MPTKRIEGAFTVKEGGDGQVFLALESGPGLLVTFELKHNATIGTARELARQMNREIVALRIE